jgi:septal ring factor EnvC (AmiA/AmiB activator)
MRKRLAILLSALAVPAFPGGGAAAQLGAGQDEIGRARAQLHDAVTASRAAKSRTAWFERNAATARDAAERTAREAAALASHVQQAEANIATADARLLLASREQAALREALGREQGPLVRLTGALQQVSRRPLALSVLRPGSVGDLVHLRAVLDSTMPQIEARTAGLRARLARSRQLREEAVAAVAARRAEQTRLADRRKQLAALAARQRLAARQASGSADREAERALALAEQARDLNALLAELGRAGGLRERLAALPGPILRPPRPEEAGLAVPAPRAPDPAATAPPAPYLLPVTGRTVAGFGAQGRQSSSGLTLAPRPGAQVVAPAAGRVAFAGPYRGYGRIVIVEHRGGWTSLVTGLARSDVAVGEELVAGAPLGVAAASGPQVTVELRRDGVPVNPLRFVR